MTEAKTCVSINNAEISSGQDAELVLEYIRFYELENPCKIAWKSLFGEGVDNYSNIEIANKYAQSISKLLCWYNGEYSSIIYKIKASGIPMDDLMNIDPLAADIDNLRKSLIFSRGIVPQIIEGMLAYGNAQPGETVRTILSADECGHADKFYGLYGYCRSY